jgi:PAS domain S-box-containing protein
LYEAGTAYPGINLVDQGIRAALDTAPYQLEVYREYMETILFPDPNDQQRFREFYIRKYQNRRPDVVITMGPSPLKFMVEMRDRGFPDVPIVFCYPNWLPSSPALASDFTGVENDLEPLETIEAALRLQPGTRHIFVVGGTAFIDRQTQALIKGQLSPYENNFDVSYLTELTMPDLLARMKHLPNHSIVLFADFSQDAAGRKFIPASEAAPAVAAAANAPVFSLVESFFNHGEVGGKVSSIRETGRIAGDMALRILGGQRPQDVPRVKSPTIYMFDWRALKRWGLNEKNLPAGSMVLNRQPTSWELYWRYVTTGVLLLFAQMLVILGLLWQRAKRRIAQTELRESEERFRLVTNTAPVTIWMTDVANHCTYANQHWLDFTGRSLESQLGLGWREQIHPEDLKRSWETFEKASAQRVPFQLERRTRRHDGEYRWMLTSGAPRFKTDGSFAGYIGSAIDITERKVSEEALSSVSRRLIEAHEEERTWIARELHDDFNQRIALLAVNLEGLKQNLRASDGQAGRRIKEAQERVSDLASDIQALSHRLHSSKLEFLGLAAAAEGFCKELSAGQNVEIAFQSNGIRKNLPQEVSLCIFRVLQEALQNAVKYSGARRFEVSLGGALNEIELTVHDSGVGFDTEQAMVGHGLGLTSMKERLKIVDGSLAIDSTLQGGTTIHARVPLPPGIKVARAVG